MPEKFFSCSNINPTCWTLTITFEACLHEDVSYFPSSSWTLAESDRDISVMVTGLIHVLNNLWEGESKSMSILWPTLNDFYFDFKL